MKGVARMPYARACKAPTTHLYDYIRPYVADLGNAVDMALIKSSGRQDRHRSARAARPFITGRR